MTRRPRSPAAASVALAAVLAGVGAAGCSGGLHSQSLVDAVRILATSADKPYAKPGDSVTIQMLAVDARPEKPAPMVLSWIPILCQNPADDAYFNCFSQLAGGGGDGGAGSGGAGAPTGLPMGVDLTPFLHNDSSFTFTMPDKIIEQHAPVAPPLDPYGLVVVFNTACAGHIELVTPDPNNVQSPPIGCFDAQHNQLGPNDFVLGLTRVYAYESVTNANPIIDHVDQDGTTVNLTAGITVSACQGKGNCQKIHVGPVVPPSSQELNPEERDTSGNELREQIWAAFYADVGSFADEARLLYDPNQGLIGDPGVTNSEYTAPDAVGDGSIWIVVHDSRGGASWVTVPVHAIAAK